MTRRITFTKRQTADILDKYANGIPVHTISDHYKVSDRVINRVLRDNYDSLIQEALEEDEDTWKNFRQNRIKHRPAKGSPGQFIKYYMWRNHIKYKQLADKMGTTAKYIRVMVHINTLSPITCYKVAKALNIDPYELGRITSDYKIRKIIEKEKNESKEI